MKIKQRLIKLDWIARSQFGFDCRKFFSAIPRIPVYISDLYKFRKNYKGALRIVPSLHDRYVSNGDYEHEYFWQDLFMAQRIFSDRPKHHLDIGSSHIVSDIKGQGDFNVVKDFYDAYDIHKSLEKNLNKFFDQELETAMKADEIMNKESRYNPFPQSSIDQVNILIWVVYEILIKGEMSVTRNKLAVYYHCMDIVKSMK